MDIMVWYTLILVISVCVIYFLWLWKRCCNLPPGPSNLPFLGYLPWIDRENPHITLTQLAQQYGPIYTLRLGSVLTIVISDAKMIRHALAKDEVAGRAPLYLTHGIMNGYGLICAQGELWKEHRKFVATGLRKLGMVKAGSMRESMEAKIMLGVNEAIERLKNYEGDPCHFLHHCLGNVMNSLVFGKTWPINDRTWKWLQYLQDEGTKLMGVAGILNFLPFLRFIPYFGKNLEFLRDGKNKTHEIYKQLVEHHDSNLDDDFIALFLEEKNKHKFGNLYCETQMMHLLADLYGAGADTTLTTIRWFLLYMAANPKIQMKIQDQIDNVIGTDQLSLADLTSLQYLDAAVCETQRIRSVVPCGIPHGTLKPVKIGEYTIPKGTMVMPLQWAVHMDECTWTDPECFQPERFLNKQGICTRPENFLPYQTGKRVCVGEELARMMLFLFCGSILQHYSVQPAAGGTINLEGKCGITLTPATQNLVFIHRVS